MRKFEDAKGVIKDVNRRRPDDTMPPTPTPNKNTNTNNDLSTIFLLDFGTVPTVG
jgi:hypothetical protein